MNSKKNLILSSVIIFNLAGCSVTPEVATERESLEQQKAVISQLEMTQQETILKVQKLENKLDEWNEMQPNVRRLVAIEAQLNTLISQLNTLAQKAQQADRKTHFPVPKQNIEAQKEQYFMLQLASLNSLESLKKTWLTIKAQHPRLLTALEVRYQHTQIKGKEYYRLKVGKFTNKEEAGKVCQALIKQKANCLLAPYSGTSLGAL